MCSIDAYLPNFKYKNGKIFFIFKNPIKLDIMKKIVWINESEINNVKLYDKIDYDILSYSLSYRLTEEECSKGLKVNISNLHRDIDIKYIPDIIKQIETHILDIDTYDVPKLSNMNIFSSNNDFTLYQGKKKSSSSSLNKLIVHDTYDDDEYY